MNKSKIYWIYGKSLDWKSFPLFISYKKLNFALSVVLKKKRKGIFLKDLSQNSLQILNPKGPVDKVHINEFRLKKKYEKLEQKYLAE